MSILIDAVLMYIYYILNISKKYISMNAKKLIRATISTPHLPYKKAVQHEIARI